MCYEWIGVFIQPEAWNIKFFGSGLQNDPVLDISQMETKGLNERPLQYIIL